MSEIGKIVIYHDSSDRILDGQEMKIIAHDGLDKYKLRLVGGSHEAVVYCQSKDFKERA